MPGFMVCGGGCASAADLEACDTVGLMPSGLPRRPKGAELVLAESLLSDVQSDVLDDSASILACYYLHLIGVTYVLCLYCDKLSLA